MTASQALQLSLTCHNIPFSFKQACNTIEEIACIRGQIDHPVLLNEIAECLNDVLRAISIGVCDGVKLKLTRLGG